VKGAKRMGPRTKTATTPPTREFKTATDARVCGVHRA
jgi:hypothetical protein